MQDLGLGQILWNDLAKKKMDMRFGTWNVRSLCTSGQWRQLQKNWESVD